MRHPGIPYAMGKVMESMIMSIEHAHNMEIKQSRAKKRMEARRKRAERKKARMEEEETWHHQRRRKEAWMCLQEMIRTVEEEGARTMMTTMMTTMTTTTGGGRDSRFGPLLPTTMTMMPLWPDFVAMHVIHPTTFGGYYHPELMRAVDEEARTTTTKIGGGDHCFGPLPTMMMMPLWLDIVAMHVLRPMTFGGYYHHLYYHHQPPTCMLNAGY